MPPLWLRYFRVARFPFSAGCKGQKKVAGPLAFWRLLKLLSSFGTESPFTVVNPMGYARFTCCARGIKSGRV